jgi:hypothetical protein
MIYRITIIYYFLDNQSYRISFFSRSHFISFPWLSIAIQSRFDLSHSFPSAVLVLLSGLSVYRIGFILYTRQGNRRACKTYQSVDLLFSAASFLGPSVQVVLRNVYFSFQKKTFRLLIVSHSLLLTYRDRVTFKICSSLLSVRIRYLSC